MFQPILPRILIIQTAFIGDVILATALLEKLHACYPNAEIHFLLRKGNEGLLSHHPYLKKLWIWDKMKNKNRGLLKLALSIRREKFTHIINPHRFGSSGLICLLSGAKFISGFHKNPFHRFYTKSFPHPIGTKGSANYLHEIERNHQLISELTDEKFSYPKLYPHAQDYAQVQSLKSTSYVCVAPSSVWFTKQWPAYKWVELLNELPKDQNIYLLGGKGQDELLAESILQQTMHPQVINLCGTLSLLQSAALMADAQMNYVNDSAPLHIATAMHAPVTAIFCSTIPEFGFGPIAPLGIAVETTVPLPCRPCGLHGYKTCPQGHFKCAHQIDIQQVLS